MRWDGGSAACPLPGHGGHLAAPSTGVDGFEYRLRTAAGASNPGLLGLAEAPVVLDNENNDAPAQAQEITLPAEVCGRIEKARARAWYRFTAKANEVVVIDDKDWAAGKTPLGYGEEEIGKRQGTLVKGQGPVLARKGVAFRLQVASDDSAEVWINGELADKDAEEDHEFKYWNREVLVPAKLLRPGKNVIAVSVCNKPGSSDLYLDLALSAEVPQEAKK